MKPKEIVIRLEFVALVIIGLKLQEFIDIEWLTIILIIIIPKIIFWALSQYLRSKYLKYLKD